MNKKTEIMQCVVNIHIYLIALNVYIIYKLLFDDTLFSRDQIKLNKKWQTFLWHLIGTILFLF